MPEYLCESCELTVAAEDEVRFCDQCGGPMTETVSLEQELRFAMGIESRLREHVAASEACPECGTRPELAREVLEAQRASAEVVHTLETLSHLLRDSKFALHPSALDAIANAARRWHTSLERITGCMGFHLEAAQ